jgi:hypothetical protein
MTIGVMPAGTKGWDCNFPVDAGLARSFYAKGYRFAVRYVGRVQRKSHDASSLELARLRRAGIAVMLVQHVKSAESWDPEGAALGRLYGQNAASFAEDCGYQYGATLWCDLEGVALGTPPSTVIAYCNAWYDAAYNLGYEPGLYVGWRAGLNAHDLYYRLRFKRYWSAFNLNRDQYPAVRGVQMRQFAASSADHVPGLSSLSAIDVNIAGKDALGSSPMMMLATGDR